MAYQTIPTGSVEIQTGLWLHTSSFTVGGVTYERRHLYSSEGYCFYDKTVEICDEEGNVIPDEDVLPNQRTYMTYSSLGKYTDVNNYVSVLAQPDFEIVSLPSNNEVA